MQRECRIFRPCTFCLTHLVSVEEEGEYEEEGQQAEEE